MSSWWQEYQKAFFIIHYLNETVLSVLVSSEDIDTLENFIYLGSIVQYSDGPHQGVLQQTGLAYAVLWTRLAWVCDIADIFEKGKDPDLQAACAPCHTLWLWDMDSN